MSRRASQRTRTAILGALWLAGCSSGDANAPATTMRDSAGIAITENDLARLPASCTIPSTPTVSIGTAEGDDAYQLFRVMGARRLGDGRIVVVNQGSQQIRFYDRNGKFLSQAGRSGRGPGEFSTAFGLWVLPGDTIWVGDYRPWQFLVFGPDGTWNRTVRPAPQYANRPPFHYVLEDGRSVLAQEPYERRDKSEFTLQHLTVVVHGPDGALIDTVGTYPNGRIGNMGADPSGPWLTPHFESFTRAAAAGSHIAIGHGSVPELFVYRAADSVRLKGLIRWTTVDRTVSPDDIAAERKRIRAQGAGMEPGMFRNLVEPQLREDRPAADQFPAFSGIIAARDGRFWVREYPTPDRPDSRNYLAFDADGRFVCRAAMPSFADVFEVGKDYLIALDRDSLGVERVLQFPIAGPVDAK